MGLLMKVRLAYMALCLCLVGCSGGDDLGVELAPASGVVTLDGKPLANPVVNFFPDTGPSGIGIGNENGEFTITTNGQPGAPVGKCKITVTVSSGDIQEAAGNEAEMNKDAPLDPKYADRNSSGLSIDVPAEGKDDIKLDLKS